MTASEPLAVVASNLVAAALSCLPTAVRRFGTGSHHYVFEATFKDRDAVVVRIAAEHSRQAMAGAYELSQLLRPRGVPLPEIIVERLSHKFSHLIFERLPGVDLGDAIRGLSDPSLEAIAAQVVRAQTITAKTALADRLWVRREANRRATCEVVAGSAG